MVPLTVTPPVRAAAPVLFWLTEPDARRFLGRVPVEGEKWVRANDPQGETALQAQNPEVVVTSWQTPPLPAAWLQSGDCRLRYVCHLGGSVRRQVPREFLEQDGLVTNWGEVATVAVAEHALLLALAALRQLDQWRPAIAAGKRDFGTRLLSGRKVGVHGFGRIARKLVQLLQPFGVEVAAFSTGVPQAMFAEAGVEPAASIEALLERSEVFFECEALTPATTGLLTAERLARLPTGAVFVNVGRGRVVDDTALAQEARAGRLRVAVDVLAKEPVNEDSTLCRIPGVIVSPHIGGPVTEDYLTIGRDARENLRRYLAGEPVSNRVDLTAYDRST